MILAHRIQLLPTPEQDTFFRKACGCSRFSWNWALGEYKKEFDAGGKPRLNELKKRFNSVKETEFPWIYESPKDANQQPFSNLKSAFSRFFKKTAGFPQFKCKGVRDSFYLSNDKFTVYGKSARLPLIGEIKLTEELRFAGKINSGTISREADRWYLSVQVEVGNYAKPLTADGVIGIDLGLKTAVTLSTGEKLEAPLPLKKNLSLLRRRSRQLSHKQKGSKNREKAKVKLSRLHAHISNIRKDWQHKLTTRLCRENQTIVVEDLCIKGMIARWGRKVADIGLYEIRRQLTYKSAIYGTELIVASRWFPSTKLCPKCGLLNSLKLSERTYRCECGYVEDRDVHAAKNLCTLGYRGSQACGEESTGSEESPSETSLGETGISECALVLT